jgi:hypothetical protein
MSEGCETLEDSKISRLRFAIGDGMEEKGFKEEEEEELPKGRRGAGWSKALSRGGEEASRIHS